MTIRTLATAVLLLAGVPAASAGQESFPDPDDVASPETIVAAAYEAVSRAPGAPFQWERFRSLFLPAARLIPNVEQTGGAFHPMSVEEFVSWIDGWYAENAPIGGPDDRGFAEEEVHSVVESYGDIAHVMSTYRKRYWGAEESLGLGINSFQLVRHDGRWWIAGIAWDEEDGGGTDPATVPAVSGAPPAGAGDPSGQSVRYAPHS